MSNTQKYAAAVTDSQLYIFEMHMIRFH